MVPLLFSILTYFVSFPPVAPITWSYDFTFHVFPLVTLVPDFQASLSKASIVILKESLIV